MSKDLKYFFSETWIHKIWMKKERGQKYKVSKPLSEIFQKLFVNFSCVMFWIVNMN